MSTFTATSGTSPASDTDRNTPPRLTGRQVNEEEGNEETDLYWLDRNYATCVPCQALQNASASDIAAVARMLESGK